jgi:hypothetical protein
VRGKDQRLTAGTGVIGVGRKRGQGGVTAANRGGWRSSEGVDGVLVARVLESGREVVEKLLRDDVVLMGCSAGARRWWISGSTAKPSDGGARSSSALRSDCSGAPERDWMGLEAPAGDGDAVCALVWQNQPKLYRLKYASPLQRASTCFKRYNPLACRVTSR